jgi:hypothetical protein
MVYTAYQHLQRITKNIFFQILTYEKFILKFVRSYKRIILV